MSEEINKINSYFVKKSILQKKVSENVSQCLTCERRCKIQIGKAGHCNTRINYNGDIYTIVYGVIVAKSINPIEKKPFYHFFPGSRALTIGTYGCNFDCFWCQNHHISHPEQEIVDLIRLEREYYAPETLIEDAIVNKCQGTSISFNEPTLLFEYSIEVFKLAKKEGLYNTYVSNGYMTEEVLRELVKSGLDAINIDIKGGAQMVRKYCGADVEKVWRNAKIAKELGVHVEITTLLIDDLNSEEQIIKEIAERIVNDLGELTPYHISRFFPQYKSSEFGKSRATPLELLYNAHKIAINAGLKHVYLGNVTDNKYNNTSCPNCSEIVIKRLVLGIEELSLDDGGNCKFCGYPICITRIK